jgi:hypothetical protein
VSYSVIEDIYIVPVQVFSFSEENDHQHVLDDSDEDASLDCDLHYVPNERIRSVRIRIHMNRQSTFDDRLGPVIKTRLTDACWFYKPRGKNIKRSSLRCRSER